MATFRFTDNLANPELYGIVLDTFFDGSGGMVGEFFPTKYVLAAENGRRLEYTFYRDSFGNDHVTAMDFFVPDPQAGGESIKIATIDGFDRVNAFSFFLDLFDAVDTIIGTGGADVLRSYGTSDKPGDILLGNGGNDVLSSYHRDTVLDGGAGEDTIRLMTVSGLNRSAVSGGEGFDTLELAMAGTYTFQAVGEHAALTGIERIVFKTSALKTVRLQTDQLAGLASNLAIETETENTSFRIVRKSGEAANIDLSGWNFSGWNLENAPYNSVFSLDLTEDAAYGDHVIGSIFREDIRTFGGDDFIDGGAGYDVLIGGQGADTVRGGLDDDTIVVDDGDIVSGDVIDGGEGEDRLHCVGDLRAASISNIEIVGVSGATAKLGNMFKPNALFETRGSLGALIQIHLTPGKDLDASKWSLGGWNDGSVLEIVGSAGADRIVAPTIQTNIVGGDGLDIVRFDRSQQGSSVVLDFSVPAPDGYTLQNGTSLKSIERFELVGGAARDILAGGAWSDTLSGGASVDMLDGGAGADFLDGEAGADFLDGGLGNDTYVVSGADVIVDAGGYDTFLVADSFSLASLPQIEKLSVRTESSINSVDLTGNALANTLTGNAGANVLFGADGKDTLQGLAGNDLLKGGLGNDTLWGGAGKDSFEFNTKPSGGTNVDFIVDFRAADDTIRLDDAVFKGLKRGALAKGAFVLGRKAADAQDRIIYDKAAGALYYDADGTGTAKQILIAKLPKKAALSHLDFIVI